MWVIYQIKIAINWQVSMIKYLFTNPRYTCQKHVREKEEVSGVLAGPGVVLRMIHETQVLSCVRPKYLPKYRIPGLTIPTFPVIDYLEKQAQDSIRNTGYNL